MKKTINIVKGSGGKEPFSKEKYQTSLKKSGASKETIAQALKNIIPFLKEGMTTKEIYNITHKFLKHKKMLSIGGRYNLRQAIMQLGPSGYPFEKYVAELLKKQGYSISVGKEIQGKCAKHEMDVIAKNKTEQMFIECKFHNRRGIRCNLQTVLYIKARFDDIQDYFEQRKTDSSKKNKCHLVTNTKITSVAIKYGKCRNINMIAWAYPHNNSLEKIIDQMTLHPITCLTTISKKIKQNLLAAGIVLCRELSRKSFYLKKLRLPQKKIDAILQECKIICEIK